MYLIDMNNNKDQQEQGIYNIPTLNIPSLFQSIKKLQKKAEKLGLGGIKMEIIKEYHTQLTDDLGFMTEKVRYTQVSIQGTSPIIEGWKFVASMDFSEAYGLLLKKMDADEILPEHYLKDNGDAYLCEHCNSRRARRKAYLVKNIETGEWKQVGSACIKDFTGHVSPAQLARYWGFMMEIKGLSEDAELKDFWEKKSLEERGYLPLTGFLSQVACISRTWGFVTASSARKDDGISTAVHVVNWNHEQSTGKIGYRSAYYELEVTEQDVKLAQDAIEWASKIEESECLKNDFLFNLQKIADYGIVPEYHVGHAGYMIEAYKKDMNVQAQREAKDNKVTEYYPGELKERKELRGLQMTFKTSFETMYGVTTLYRFEQGNYVFVWFSSSVKELEQGDVVDMVATIKKFEEYKGTKQTIITRAKIIKGDSNEKN